MKRPCRFFAAAARRMNRAQSAITYTIQKLEEQSGLPLFDRSAYRPILTDAGKALLPRARRILDDVADWRQQAQGISKGLEAELTLAVVSYAPPDLLSRVLSTFNAEFPFVEIRLLIETFDAAATALRNGTAISLCLPNVSQKNSSAACAVGSIWFPSPPLRMRSAGSRGQSVRHDSGTTPNWS